MVFSILPPHQPAREDPIKVFQEALKGLSDAIDKYLVAKAVSWGLEDEELRGEHKEGVVVEHRFDQFNVGGTEILLDQVRQKGSETIDRTCAVIDGAEYFLFNVTFSGGGKYSASYGPRDTKQMMQVPSKSSDAITLYVADRAAELLRRIIANTAS